MPKAKQKRSGKARQPPARYRKSPEPDIDPADDMCDSAEMSAEVSAEEACRSSNSNALLTALRLADVLEENQGMAQKLNALMDAAQTNPPLEQPSVSALTVPSVLSTITSPMPSTSFAPAISSHIQSEPLAGPEQIKNTALNSVLKQSMPGEPTKQQDAPEPKISLHTFNETIGPHVPDTVREDIWAHKNVDLTLLLPIYLKPLQKPESPKQKVEMTTIEQWTSAFIVYVGIYAEKFPLETTGLMKHMEVVRELGNRGGQAWQLYDSNFRQYRAQNPSALKWGYFLGETWNRAVVENNFSKSKNPKSFQQQNTFRNNSQITKGCCFNYNQQGFCTFQGCKYNHICALCKKGHPMSHCTFKKRFSPYSKQFQFGTAHHAHKSPPRYQKQPFQTSGYQRTKK